MPIAKATSSQRRSFLRGQPCRECCDGRRTDDDAERVGRDHPSGLRVRVGRRRRIERRQQVVREVRQQPDGDEFGRTDAETAHGEGQERKTNTGRRQLRRPVGGGVHTSRLQGNRRKSNRFDKFDDFGVMNRFGPTQPRSQYAQRVDRSLLSPRTPTVRARPPAVPPCRRALPCARAGCPPSAPARRAFRTRPPHPSPV